MELSHESAGVGYVFEDVPAGDEIEMCGRVARLPYLAGEDREASLRGNRGPVRGQLCSCDIPSGVAGESEELSRATPDIEELPGRWRDSQGALHASEPNGPPKTGLILPRPVVIPPYASCRKDLDGCGVTNARPQVQRTTRIPPVCSRISQRVPPQRLHWSWFGMQQLRIQGLDRCHVFRETKLCLDPSSAGSAESSTPCGVRQQGGHCPGQGGSVARGHEQAGFARNYYFGNPPCVGGHDSLAHGHRLDDHSSEMLPHGWQDEKVTDRQDVWHVIAPAGEAYMGLESERPTLLLQFPAEFTFAHQDPVNIRPGVMDQPGGLQKIRVPFKRNKTSDAGYHGHALWKAEGCTKPWGSLVRNKPSKINAVMDAPDFPGPCPLKATPNGFRIHDYRRSKPNQESI